MQRNVGINYDLETTPLYIKTDSAEGSNDKLELNLYRSGEYAGAIFIYFSSPLKYILFYCTSWNNFHTTLPSTTDKVWKITVTKHSGIRLVIHCNDVEVLNVLMNDSTCSDNRWTTYWTRDVEKIYFSATDNASDFYSSHLPITPGTYFCNFN